MKKILFVLFFLTFGITFGYAESLEMAQAELSAIKVLNLIFLGAKVVGAIVIILGIIELLVEKEQGNSNEKKVTGAMKIAGGVLLLLAATVILWMIGENDTSGGNSLIKAKS